MYRSNKVSVVVPCYNEEMQIGKVVETMPDFIDSIIIVEDKSTDDTLLVVEKLAREDSRIVLIKHPKNQGVGGAIASGYKWSRDNSVDLSAVMAGDAQMDPRDLPSLLDPVIDGRCDYSKANRLISEVSYRKIPKVRFFGNSILSLLTKIASGYWHVADSQTGYTVINLRALRAIDLDNMFKRYGQPNDLLVRLNVAGMRVLDVPTEPVYHVGEKSGINIKKAIFSIGWLLVKLFFWRLKEKYVIRSFHPLVFFYLFGFISLAVSSMMFLRLISLWIKTGAVPEITFLTWMFSFSIAFNSIGFAMWFDYEENKHLNPPSDNLDLIGKD